VQRVEPRTIEVTISEGRNRQVRRMIEAIDNRALRLQRVRFGSLGLERLREGEARRLSAAEVERLREDVDAAPRGAGGSGPA
jgi:pseudouridine synthase